MLFKDQDHAKRYIVKVIFYDVVNKALLNFRFPSRFTFLYFIIIVLPYDDEMSIFDLIYFAFCH